jgi:membrane protein DedA with SNARE-associated domain
MWTKLAGIFSGTFVSEDLTSITTGLLIRSGEVALAPGLLACFLGIYVGDLGLWLLGRLAGRRVLQWGWGKRRLPLQRLEQFGPWFDQHGWSAVLASRFVPGTRLPLYLAAGMLGRKAGRFALWTFIAAMLWTPLVVISILVFGEPVVELFSTLLGPGWLALLLAVLALFFVLRVGMLACSRIGRAKLIAKVSKLWRWEFWPSWLFYIPILPCLGYLSIRYRGVMTWTGSNPGIPQGGVVGESKYDILTQLPAEWVVPTLLVPSGEPTARLEQIRKDLAANGWPFPLILKPDASQRGAGVKLARDMADVEAYMRQQPAAFLIQTYHPGPFEAGIFYYRIPGEPTGHIFSITDKRFSFLIGDGRSTLEELIWQHPRYRMQAGTFLKRHEPEKDRVLRKGETFALALAGNHCQGTMFRDGSHLITPELERTIDGIARQFRGFFVGRFDIRYRDLERFRAGQDLAIVELNGATSESTNIYDPSWSLWRAYRTLFRQWALLYEIGHRNRQFGHRPTSTRELLRQVLAYYRQVQVNPLAD